MSEKSRFSGIFMKSPSWANSTVGSKGLTIWPLVGHQVHEPGDLHPANGIDCLPAKIPSLRDEMETQHRTTVVEKR